MSLLLHLKAYSRTDALADLTAGSLTAAILIPQALAFAALAGLPPQFGLYASVLPPLVYAMIGGSRVMSVGPVSVAALMVATTLGSLNAPAQRGEAAVMLAAWVAITLLVAGALRLGRFADYLCAPVLHGFTSGAAILIAFAQIPVLLGIAPDTMHGLTLASLLRVDLPVALVGVSSLSLMIFWQHAMRGVHGRLNPATLLAAAVELLGRAAPILVLVIAALAVGALESSAGERIKQVGPIVSAWPAHFGLGATLNSGAAQFFLPAAAIALIAYAESIAIAKQFSVNSSESVNANRELLALGGANLAAAASGAMPVAGGFSRTAVNVAAGARTQVATIFAVALIVVVTALWGSLFAHAPVATLAAIIILGVVKLIDWQWPALHWHQDRPDVFVFVLTAMTTIFVGFEAGLLAGIVYAWVQGWGIKLSSKYREGT